MRKQMKTTFLTLAFGFIGGALLSYSQTAQHYEAEAIRVGKMYTTNEALAGTWSATKC